MVPNQSVRKKSYIFLCMILILALIAAAATPLRVPGLFQVIGGVLFTTMAIAVWLLGGRVIRTDSQVRKQLALAGVLLVAPFAFVALFWVGLGTPWDATAGENQMRYLVLIAMAIAIAGGFVMLREALSETGERFFSTIGFAAILLAGPLYLLWDALMFEMFYSLEHAGKVAPAIIELNETLDLVLFMAGALTYIATAAFAVSLGRAGWLGRRAVRIYVVLNFVALIFLMIRGLQYPDPNALSEPWYMSPGFVAGIPAIPFIMPFFFGVVLLRRAGEERT